MKKIDEKLMLRLPEQTRRYVPIVLFALGLLMIGASCPKAPPAPPFPDALDGSTPSEEAAVGDAPVSLQDALVEMQDVWSDVQQLLDAAVCPVSDQTPCGLDCTRLCTLGCEDGRLANCTSVCKRAEATPGMPKFDHACIAKAAGQVDVRKCSAVKCR